MVIEIQILQPKDLDKLNQLLSVFEDVFEMENFKRPNPTHLHHLLKRNDFFVVTAAIENEIMGGLTVYVLEQYYAEKPVAYIYDLAVARAFQRKGVGTKLIEFTNAYCRRKGYEEVFVQADEVDNYALDFYRSTKPTSEEQVVHFNYKINKNT